MGNDVQGGNGLSEALLRCTAATKYVHPELPPKTGAPRSLSAVNATLGEADSVHGRRLIWLKKAQTQVWGLLSFLAILSEELADGSQGTMLIAAGPSYQHDAEWDMNAPLKRPNIVIKVEGHHSFSQEDDFMMGGKIGQALTDIAGGVVGGGGQLCDLATTQDESLVHFYGEVLAFAFFAAPQTFEQMLQVPLSFYGTRRYLNQIEGNSYGGKCGKIS